MRPGRTVTTASPTYISSILTVIGPIPQAWSSGLSPRASGEASPSELMKSSQIACGPCNLQGLSLFPSNPWITWPDRPGKGRHRPCSGSAITSIGIKPVLVVHKSVMLAATLSAFHSPVYIIKVTCDNRWAMIKVKRKHYTLWKKYLQFHWPVPGT